MVAFDPSRRALFTGRRGAVPAPAAEVDPQTLRPIIGAACLTARGSACMTCADACPHGAIRLRPTLGAPARPVIDTTRCDGCGECLAPCPTSAIELHPATEVAHA